MNSLDSASRSNRVLRSDGGDILKKYLVVKMAEGWSHVVNWVVMPGLYTMEAAQQFVASAMADEPGARYMIQEVGAA
jgi:hypothetical protein